MKPLSSAHRGWGRDVSIALGERQMRVFQPLPSLRLELPRIPHVTRRRRVSSYLPIALFTLVLPIVFQGSHGIALGQAEQPPKVSLESVQKAVRMLEADTLQKRDEAEKQLVEMGSGVLPYLPVVNARTSGELKIRLQRIRSALQTTEVEIFFEASTVTLSGKLNVVDAINQIAEQTDNHIQLQGEDALTNVDVEVDAKDQPFWSVMNSIMKQANLRINAFGSTEGELVLVPGGQPRNGPDMFTTGPFQVEALSVKSSVQFGSNLGGILELSLQVTWEPRLKPVFMKIPMANFAAKLSDTQSLSASNPQAAPEIPLNYGGCSTQVDLQFERPCAQLLRLKNSPVSS